MTPEQIAASKAKFMQHIESMFQHAHSVIDGLDCITEQHKSVIKRCFDHYKTNPDYSSHDFQILMANLGKPTFYFYFSCLEDDDLSELFKSEDGEDVPLFRMNNNQYNFGRDWAKKVLDDMKFWDIQRALNGLKEYDLCLDSDPVEFDGDIIITDPCYVVKDQDCSERPRYSDYSDHKEYDAAYKKWEETNPDHWRLCEYGDNMTALGIKHFMTRNTMFGDWSCTTYNTDTKKPIGHFGADAGLVSVMYLNEVLAYNPDYNHHIEKDWCVTLIKDFKGTVQFVVEEDENADYDDFDRFLVHVVGKGINKVTGEPINFITKMGGYDDDEDDDYDEDEGDFDSDDE